ncbi:hypothetical protein ACWGPT_11265 [Pseudorhizobium sp. NPDC055634]
MPKFTNDQAERRGNRGVLLAYAVVLTAGTACLSVIPVLTGSYSFYFYLLMWIALAAGINIMAGFTGYVAFGYVAFFGLGS